MHTLTPLVFRNGITDYANFTEYLINLRNTAQEFLQEQSSAISYAPTMAAFLAITLSFLIGSIPISWLIGKIKYNIDLRTFGDGNVGAGNLQRATGLKIGIFAIIADLAKGALAIGLSLLLDTTDWVIMAAGTAAVIGHILPPWLKFRGGRGAATALGVAVGITPIPGAIMLLIGLLMMLFIKKTLPSIAISVICVIGLSLILSEPTKYIIFLIILFSAVGLKDGIDRLKKAPK